MNDSMQKKTFDGKIYRVFRGEEGNRGPWLGWIADDNSYGIQLLQRVEGGPIDGQLLPDHIVLAEAWRQLVANLSSK